MVSGRYFWMLVATSLVLAAVPARSETIQVTISKLVFSPAAIHAKVGDMVEWINKDSLVHTATVRDGWEVMIPANKEGTLILREAGEFEYYCRFHPNMKGSIAVTAP